MGDAFQDKNGSLSKKQEGYLSSTNGGPNKQQTANLVTAEKNSQLSEQIKKANKVPAVKPFKGTW